MEAPHALQPNDRELLYRRVTFQRNRSDREAAQQFIDSPDLLHLMDLAGIDREMASSLPFPAPIPYSVKFYHGGGQRDPALLAMSAAHLFFLISILE